MHSKKMRRLAGVLGKRLPEMGFSKVADQRRQSSCRWSLSALLTAVVTAFTAGCRSLAQMESLTADASRSMRRLLGLARRVPDTTVRSVLIKLSPNELRKCLHRQIRAAHRRKALRPVGLPFGVVTLDGKVTAIKGLNGPFTQRREKEGEQYGLVRSVSAVLTSSAQKACIDANPIPRSTNEMGHFLDVLAELVEIYGSLDLFRLVTYDAGACSKVHAREITGYGLDYFFNFKPNERKLTARAKRLLAADDVKPVEVHREKRGSQRVVRALYLTSEALTWPHWANAKTAIRVQRTVYNADGGVHSVGDRYWISSLDASELTCSQWLHLARAHWGVENNGHNTWDTVLVEDDRPWITQDGVGCLNVMLLRRLAYNVLAFQRIAARKRRTGRLPPWRDLIRGLYNTIIAATDRTLAGLKEVQHRVPIVD